MNRTTLCQVGATTGVALLEGSKGVNKFVLGKTAFGWILTLIIAGIGAGLVVAQGVHAPLAGAYDVPDTPQVSPPLECIFGYIPFSRRWDTVRYSGIQLNTARYVRVQLDTVGYSGTQWICCKMDRYRIDTGIYGTPKIR